MEAPMKRLLLSGPTAAAIKTKEPRMAGNFCQAIGAMFQCSGRNSQAQPCVFPLGLVMNGGTYETPASFWSDRSGDQNKRTKDGGELLPSDRRDVPMFRSE